MSQTIFKKITDKIKAADWRGYLFVIGLCVIAVWPFVSRSSLPQETDAELHIYRLAELSRLIRAGVFYPRWSPNFYFGYGYPIFNYYAPLSYYVGLLFDFLPVVGPVGAVKSVFVLGTALSGLGMYGFVRDNFGRYAGLVAAVVYVYAPYIHYVDPHARGVLAETFSFGVWAMALWAFDRLRCEATTWNWLTAVFGMAAIVLTHNLMAMIFAGLLLAWILWQMMSGVSGQGAGGGSMFQVSGFKLGWLQSEIQNSKFKIHPVIAYGLGIFLAAFFWLPVGLERNAVNLGTLVGEEGSHFDFRQHFLSIRELFSFSAWLDWGASEPFYLLNLGVAQWLLGGLGIGLLIWSLWRHRLQKRAEWQALFFAIAAVVLILLMLPVATPLWEAIPLLPFIQFPWRLLGAAVSMLAVLSGYAVFVLGGWWPKRQVLITAVAITGTIAAALPLTQVQPWPADFGETTVARIAYIETRGRWLGTTSTADFVPATVDTIPQPTSQLLEDLLANQTPDRTNYWSVETAGATSTWEEIDPLHTRYTINTPDDFLFRLFQFQFPGWEVRVDGQPVEVEVGRPEGFMVIPVPAGEHVVDVQFKDTAARRWSWIISGLALVVAVAVSVFGRQETGVETAERTPPMPLRLWWLPLVLLLMFIPLDQAGWLRYESVETVEQVQRPLSVDFGGQITLLGADISDTQARPGETVDVTVYWSAQQKLDINYQAFIHLLAADGFLVSQSDKLNPSDFPTRRWPLDKYVRDTYVVTVPEGVSPGTYRLAAGLWVAAEGWRLPVLDENGQQVGDNFVVGEIEIVE